MKKRIIILFLIAATCIPSASVFAKTTGIPVVPSSDYRYLIANLGNRKLGSAYSWTVDGKVAKKGVLEETFFLATDGNLKSARGAKPSSTKGVSYVSGRFGKAFVAPKDGVSYGKEPLNSGFRLVVTETRLSIMKSEYSFPIKPPMGMSW